MPPQTKRAELPSRTKVRSHLQNKMVDFWGKIHVEIQAVPSDTAVNWDLWTQPHTSAGIFGMLAHWIEFHADAPWQLRMEVIASRAISGDPTGENLARWFLRYTDHAEITSKQPEYPNKASLTLVSCSTLN